MASKWVRVDDQEIVDEGKRTQKNTQQTKGVNGERDGEKSAGEIENVKQIK